MHDTFVAPAGWSWDIVLYFYFGGIAGGLFVISSLLRLVGDRGDWRLSRIGYYLALPLLIVCTILLIKDLGKPGRFRSEEHTSELQSRGHLVFRLLLERKN